MCNCLNRLLNKCKVLVRWCHQWSSNCLAFQDTFVQTLARTFLVRFVLFILLHVLTVFASVLWCHLLFLDNKNVLFVVIPIWFVGGSYNMSFVLCLMVLSKISVISWRSVLLVEETGEPGESHRHVASHWQTNVRLALIEIRTHNISVFCFVRSS